MQIVEAGSPEWEAVYDQIPPAARDVFHDPAFARVCSETINDGARVAAAIYSGDDTVILYPFVVRTIGDVTGHSEISEGCFDIVGLYGRGGMLCISGDGDTLTEFHTAFADWCRSEKIICAFDRYHPMLENQCFASDDGQVFDVGSFVVVDLRPDIGDVEANFRHSMRKAIRKGDRAGVTVEVREDLEGLDTFLSIYHGTLDRNGARPFYYFSESFYRAIAREMQGRFAFYYGSVDGQVVTCELVLFSGHFGHSYLGGTCDAAFQASANQILKRQILRDLKNRGCEYFLLGGGQRPDDGVYRYKAAYAPDGARPSYIGGTVFMPDEYESLRRRMQAHDLPISSERFQFYDAG